MKHPTKKVLTEEERKKRECHKKQDKKFVNETIRNYKQEIIVVGRRREIKREREQYRKRSGLTEQKRKRVKERNSRM